MDLRKLKTLIDLVSESNVWELEITDADGKVRIVKGGTGPAQHCAAVAAPAAIAVAAAPAVQPVEVPAVSAAPLGHIVKSPMVGTFYRSSGPGSPAFVEVGSAIKQGQTVCIVEAMKILNEIESDVAGTITQVFCVNGQAVEYGQPLFTVV